MPTSSDAVVTFRDISSGLRDLKLERSKPVIAHCSLGAFGNVRGGAETMLGALLTAVDTLVMPTFTYKTMLVPEDGPAGNAMTYGGARDQNLLAESFRATMPADPLMGAVTEALRRHASARRSSHPILSFAGIRAEEVLACQSIDEPLAPIGALAERDGWVLLLGVDHTANTAIHYGERLAGRKQFMRWALSAADRAQACPRFPGCSDGFGRLSDYLVGIARQTVIGAALVQAIPLADMVAIVQALIEDDPSALLCRRKDCERCGEVRRSLAAAALRSALKR